MPGAVQTLLCSATQSLPTPNEVCRGRGRGPVLHGWGPGGPFSSALGGGPASLLARRRRPKTPWGACEPRRLGLPRAGAGRGAAPEARPGAEERPGRRQPGGRAVSISPPRSARLPPVCARRQPAARLHQREAAAEALRLLRHMPAGRLRAGCGQL